MRGAILEGKFAFSALLFDAESGELSRNGIKLRVPEQAARVLRVLLEKHGKVVTREELRQILWPTGEFLDYDHSINNSISQLRDVLRDDSRTPRFIETIPKRGYRFLAEVRVLPDEAPTANSPTFDLGTVSPPHKVGSTVSDALVNPELRGPLHPYTARIPWKSTWFLAAAFVVLGALGALGVLVRHKSPTQRAENIYVGIAPFEISGPGAEQLADSFRLDLTDAVSQLPSVQVRAAHSFPASQRDDASIPTLARNLQIDTVLFGKFTIHDNECLIQFELVRGRDGIHLASLQYSGTKAELTAIRDKAQRDIFARLNLATNREHPSHGGTENPRAFEAYLRARYHLSQWTDESVIKSLQEFETAINEDPGFAKAYAGLASAHFVLAEHEVKPKLESFAKARELAEKAIQMDASLAEAHAMLGQIALNQDWNFPLAEKELRLAVDLEPNQAIYHLWFSILLCIENRFEESLQQIDLAHAADTFWPPVYMTEIFLAGAARESQDRLRPARN